MVDTLATLQGISAAFCLVAALTGCGRSGAGSTASQTAAAELAKTLADGNQLLVEMKVAARERKYVELFSNYEALRLHYLDAARVLEQPGLNTNNAQALATLAEWEFMIFAARNVWQGPVLEPAEIPLDEIPPKFRPAIENPTREFQRLLDESKANRRRTEERWAPVDAQVDEAMKKMHALRLGQE